MALAGKETKCGAALLDETAYEYETGLRASQKIEMSFGHLKIR
jgi:hypothetical protein